MLCSICNTVTSFKFTKLVLNKYEVKYYKCDNCGFVQTENPYWLNESYSRAINYSDTGILQRNIYFSTFVSNFILEFIPKGLIFLDYGGGYGIFVRLMRDKGFNFLRHDLYCENLFANGFDYPDVSENRRFDLISAFEVFEHLVAPSETLDQLFKISDILLFSTELYIDSDLENWNYLAPYHGQHISFYSLKTLDFIAKLRNLYLYSDNKGLHILSRYKLGSNPFEQPSLLNKILRRIFKKKNKKSLTLDDSEELITKGNDFNEKTFNY